MQALIFDLDGTLVDSVYAHIAAWQSALSELDMHVDGWRIHRRIGMSGGLFTRAMAREIGREVSAEQKQRLQDRHAQLFRQFLPNPRPFAGARELLEFLRAKNIVHCIATSGQRSEITASLASLGVGEETPVITRSEVQRAKPEPDLFLASQKKLGVHSDECYVIGDSVWDLLAARRAGMLGIGLLTGGYGEDELTKAGAFRIYRDPAQLHASLDELGILQ